MGKCVLKTEEKEFEPITFEVTVENEDELRWLWHAFNINCYGEQTSLPQNKDVSVPKGRVTPSHFWRPVDNVVRSLGLRRGS
jgi:hypothetical protein